MLQRLNSPVSKSEMVDPRTRFRKLSLDDYPDLKKFISSLPPQGVADLYQAFTGKTLEKQNVTPIIDELTKMIGEQGYEIEIVQSEEMIGAQRTGCFVKCLHTWCSNGNPINMVLETPIEEAKKLRGIEQFPVSPRKREQSPTPAPTPAPPAPTPAPPAPRPVTQRPLSPRPLSPLRSPSRSRSQLLQPSLPPSRSLHPLQPPQLSTTYVSGPECVGGMCRLPRSTEQRSSENSPVKNPPSPRKPSCGCGEPKKFYYF